MAMSISKKIWVLVLIIISGYAGSLCLEYSHEKEYQEVSRTIRLELDGLSVDAAAKPVISNIKNKLESLDDSSKNLLLMEIGIFFAICLFGIAMTGMMTVRLISKPLSNTLTLAQKMSKGDFTGHLDVAQNDEIGMLAESLNEMVSKIGEAVGESIRISSDLASSASQQAAAVEETSSSLEEMASMTRQNADNASEANSLMAEARETVDKANNSMVELTSSMEEIARASEETSKIIKAIDEIAFQTNLLALNAAVEAARAGEAGAGFSIVADEVRNLAMRTTEAAKNTAELIESTVKNIKDGTGLVSRTNDNFFEVTRTSAKIGDLIAEISSASREQAHGIEEINKTVVDIDKSTQQNAASSDDLKTIMNMFTTSGHDHSGPSSAQRLSHPSNFKPLSHASAQIGQDFDNSAFRTRLPSSANTNKSEVRPEDIIPLDDDDLSDF